MVEESPWPDLIPTFSGDVVGLIPLFPAAMVAPVPQASATPAGEPSFGGLQHLAFGVRSGSVSAPLSLGGEGTPEATPIGGVESVPAQVEARLRYETPDQAAEQADAIPQRWEEGESVLTAEPFSDVMTVESSSVSATDSNVVAIDFATVGGTNSWIQLIQVRDLSPFLPVEG